jgi:alpha-L-fucosidase
LKFAEPMPIDTVLLQEDIIRGERVRQYSIEGRSGGEWRTLGEGTSIGHKRIQPIEPITVDTLRVVVTRSAGTPIYRRVAAFHTAEPPPSGWNAAPPIWAANEVGAWRDHSFSIDLTAKIDAAAQYRLRFVPRAGTVTGLKNLVLKLHGVAEPNFFKVVKGTADQVILNITGVAETVQVSGRVEGAESGNILLQKF